MSHLATINLLSRWAYYELENTLPSTLQRILKLCAKNTGQNPNIHNSLYYYTPGYRIINSFLIEWELIKFSGSSFFFFFSFSPSTRAIYETSKDSSFPPILLILFGKILFCLKSDFPLSFSQHDFILFLAWIICCIIYWDKGYVESFKILDNSCQLTLEDYEETGIYN